MPGVMPLSSSPRPHGPCPDISAYQWRPAPRCVSARASVITHGPLLWTLVSVVFAASFAHPFVYRRLPKPGRNRLALTIALTVIQDHMPGMHDVCAQLRQRLHQWRWIVERTFGWLNRSRRLSKDFEALPETTETWIRIAMIQLRVRRLAAKV